MNILLTGASRGLGLEIAKQQLALGHDVFIVNRSVSDELQALLDQYTETATFIECDLGQPDSIKERVFDRHIGWDTPLHGLVNNAAISHSDLATNLDHDTIADTFRPNVYSPMMLSKLVIRNMLLHRTMGSLVHVSSICAHTGYKGLAMYAATKGALEAFSKNLAREWGSKGIRSNCVVPGFMETAMSDTLSEDQRMRIYRRTALQRSVSIASAASSVSFLLSEASHSITGQNLVVDCGAI